MTIEESSLVHRRIDEHLRRDVAKIRIAQVQSVLVLSTLWYTDVLEGLKASTREFFDSVEIAREKLFFFDVPGSLELPFAARLGIEGRLNGQKKAPDMVVILGCVQQGSTPHFDYVCQTTFSALMDIQLQKKIAMGYGLLTVNTLEQARQRLSKGFEASQAALFMYLSQNDKLVEVK